MGRLLDLITNKYPYTDFHELNLSWLLEIVTELIKNTESLDEWKIQHEEEYEELKKIVNDIDTGNWSPEYITAITNFFSTNLVDIVGELVKQVYFGVTADGHFVAYIPESWNDITFGTSGYDDFPAGIDYGHLTLSY